MSRDGQRLVGFAMAMGAVLFTLGALGERLLGCAAGPEAEIVTLLKKAERGVELPIGAYGSLASANLQYQRLSVNVDLSAGTAIASGTLDFTGVFAKDTRVSSLGLERVRFSLIKGDWVPIDGVAPRLSAIVQALEGRRRRLEVGDFGETGDTGEITRLRQMSRRAYRSDAWFIRSEREEVEVAEDYRLTGDSPARPTDEKATKRLTLTQDPSGQFFFPNGLL